MTPPPSAPEGGWTRTYLLASGRLLPWIVLRALAQVALVLLLARGLGAEVYGRFVAVLAVASFLTPLAGLGAPGVVLRETSRASPNAAGLLRAAVRLWACTLLVLVPLGATGVLLALPRTAPAAAVVVFLLAEIGGTSLVEIVARHEQGRGRASRYGALQVGLIGVRLGALLLLWVLAVRSRLAWWMGAYASATVVYALALVVRALGLSSRAPRVSSVTLAGRAWPFAAGTVAQRVQTEFNKPVLAAVSFAAVAELNVAQRAVDVVALPLVALQETLWPHLYRRGTRDTELRRALGVLVSCALLAAVLLRLVLAPLLPLIFGSSFAASARLVGFLAALPLLQLGRNAAHAAAAAAGRMHTIGLAAAAGAAGGVVGTLLLVPRMGLLGAAAALYAAELLVVSVHLGVLLGQRRARRSSPS